MNTVSSRVVMAHKLRQRRIPCEILVHGFALRCEIICSFSVHECRKCSYVELAR